MGVTLGHVESDALGLVTMVGLVTIAASTYMITYSHQLYRVFEPMLGVFERKDPGRETGDGAHGKIQPCDVIVFGLGRLGAAIGVRLKNQGVRALGVDFNPMAVRRWRALGLVAQYGDASDPEFLASLPLDKAKWIVATIPIHHTGLSYEDVRKTLLQIAHASAFRGKIAVTSHGQRDDEVLQGLGADLVLEPFQDAADRAVELLTGAEPIKRTEIPDIAAEEKIA